MKQRAIADLIKPETRHMSLTVRGGNYDVPVANVAGNLYFPDVGIMQPSEGGLHLTSSQGVLTYSAAWHPTPRATSLTSFAVDPLYRDNDADIAEDGSMIVVPVNETWTIKSITSSLRVAANTNAESTTSASGIALILYRVYHVRHPTAATRVLRSVNLSPGSYGPDDVLNYALFKTGTSTQQSERHTNHLSTDDMDLSIVYGGGLPLPAGTALMPALWIPVVGRATDTLADVIAQINLVVEVNKVLQS